MVKRTKYGAVKHSARLVASALDREIVRGRPDYRTVTFVGRVIRGQTWPSGKAGYLASVCPASTRRKMDSSHVGPKRNRCGDGFAKSPTDALKKATLSMLKKMR